MKRTILAFAVLFLAAAALVAPAATPAEELKGLKSFGTSGKAVYPFVEGSKTEATLYEHEGSGCLTHMWFGGKWENYEEMRIRVYVDGEDKASIDMELFLGHGIGYKDGFGPWGTTRIGKTGQPSGTYFFNRGMYHTEVAGLTHLNTEDHSFSAYRFHEEDPIFCEKGLRLTLRCGEQIGGQRHKKEIQTWKAPPTTYTTYVWMYEW